MQALCPVSSGRALQRPFTAMYVQAEAYVAARCGGGAASVRLSALLAAHEDVAALQREHPSFAWHVLRSAQQEDAADGVPPADEPVDLMSSDDDDDKKSSSDDSDDSSSDASAEVDNGAAAAAGAEADEWAQYADDDYLY